MKNIALVISILAHGSAQDQNDVKEAFGAAVNALGSGGRTLLAKVQNSIAGLDPALETLEKLKPVAQSRLLKACVASIGRDQRFAAAVKVELLRAFAGANKVPVQSPT
jgi:hypothetical protein